MIGQFILSGISGLELNDDEKRFLEDIQPAGVILFSRNYENPDQLRALSAQIQNYAKELPFLIGVDQEGGRVQRFRDGFTRIPSMMELASRNSAKEVFETHQTIADELIECGINLNFSPVCDTLSNQENQVIGDRSFSRDAIVVEKYVSAAIRGMLTKRLICCAKHFPGHGRSLKDSHLEKVIVSMSQEVLDYEMIPFKKAIKSKVPMLMPSHMVVDYFDQDLPCSMSPNAMKYIRKELGFRGVIISDDFNMNAIKQEFSIEKASSIAIEAGCDIICFRDMPMAEMAYNFLVKHGVSDIRIDETFQRINDLKSSFL